MLDTPITQWVKIISEGVCTVLFVNDVAAEDQPKLHMETFLMRF